MADPHWGPVEKKPRAAGSSARSSSSGPKQAAASKPAGKTATGKSGRRPRSRTRRVVGFLFKSVAALVILGLVSLTALVVVGYRTTELPDPNADFTTATSFVYYNDGKSELGDFAVQNRQPLAFKDMPENIKQAVVAGENRTFWTDKGISVRGMFRAAYVIARGGSLQGGSTITQQYIKILYLDQNERTATRKFRELFLAYKLNQQVPKEQILEGYLNTIYFGHGAYGIQAAAQAFFGVDAKDLSVSQSAVLASVINNPSAFDPSVKTNRPALLDRYRYVLQSMADTGDITPAKASKYAAELPKFPKIKVNDRYGGPDGFLLKMVEQELAQHGFSSQDINGGGLKITTTFDEDAQKAAVAQAQKITKQAANAAAGKQKASKLHAAIASVDVNSGDVLALYGGPDFVKNSRNWATTHRPAASTFKAYTLAAGLKDGFNLRSRFHGDSFYLPDSKIVVRNENSTQYGYSVDLTKATQESINTAFVDLTTQMTDGGPKTLKLAKAAGLPKTVGWDAAPRNIPIGTPEVSPLDQASGYAMFANGGTAVENHVVQQVRDRNGKVVYEAKPAEKKVVSNDIADDVTYALSQVVARGTGSSLSSFNRPSDCYSATSCPTVAGKTGTNGTESPDKNNGISSAWFVGYTQQVSTAVMFVAGKQGQSNLDPYRRPGDSAFFGATYPATLWKDYMTVAMKGKDPKPFDPPAYANSDQPRTSTPAPQSTQKSRGNGGGSGGNSSSGGGKKSSGPSTAKPQSSRAPSAGPATSAPAKNPDPNPTGKSGGDNPAGGGPGKKPAGLSGTQAGSGADTSGG